MQASRADVGGPREQPPSHTFFSGHVMSGDWKNRMHSFSRRRFLKALSSAAFGSGGSPSAGFSFAGVAAGPASAQATSAPAFEDVPPRSSGIAWVHSNGRSPEM